MASEHERVPEGRPEWILNPPRSGELRLTVHFDEGNRMRPELVEGIERLIAQVQRSAADIFQHTGEETKGYSVGSGSTMTHCHGFSRGTTCSQVYIGNVLYITFKPVET